MARTSRREIFKNRTQTTRHTPTARRDFQTTLLNTRRSSRNTGVPPRVVLDDSIEIPIYVNGKQSYGNLGNQCDNPTYLGKETISGSTLQRYEGRAANGTPLPHVVWVSFGRNSSDDHRRVVGSVQMIGYNRQTGATAFFESSDQISQWVNLDRGTLRMRGTLPWIDDPEQFNRAFRTPGTTQCVQCHQNDLHHERFHYGCKNSRNPNACGAYSGSRLTLFCFGWRRLGYANPTHPR